MSRAETDYYADWDAAPSRQLFPGVTITVISGAKLMFSRVDIAPGGVVPEHSHPHEQAGYVVEGEAEFTIGGQQRRLHAGDYYLIPGNTLHSVQVGTQGARCMDIFSPPREEYR